MDIAQRNNTATLQKRTQRTITINVKNNLKLLNLQYKHSMTTHYSEGNDTTSL